MIETKIEIEERKLPFKRDYNFNKPILFYIVNKKYNSASKFVIVDFIRGTLKYINTLTDDYIKKLYEFPFTSHEILDSLKNVSWDKCPKNTPFKITQPHFPHSSLCFDINDGFYNFLTAKTSQPITSFRYIDLKSNKMVTYFGEDIGFKTKRFSETSSTIYTDYFVISLDGQEKNVTYHIKCSKDMKKIELIGRTEDTSVAPHETYWYDRKIFSTEFFVKRYNIDGKIFRDDESLEKYFGELPSYDIIMELHKRGCFGHGEFNQINPDGKTITYKTGLVPSHIEHDVRNDVFYVSSHNMLVLFNTIFFLEPASIFKYRYDGELKLEGKFQNNFGYRFTSHKLFNYNDRTYFLTIGHPNRLFVVDGETMKLNHYFDIGESILEGKNDIGRFLSTEYTQSTFDPNRISTMEISEDGEYAVFLGDHNINVINIWTGKCETHPFYIDENENFFQRTFHSETFPNIRG